MIMEHVRLNYHKSSSWMQTDLWRFDPSLPTTADSTRVRSSVKMGHLKTLTWLLWTITMRGYLCSRKLTRMWWTHVHGQSRIPTHRLLHRSGTTGYPVDCLDWLLFFSSLCWWLKTGNQSHESVGRSLSPGRSGRARFLKRKHKFNHDWGGKL